MVVLVVVFVPVVEAVALVTAWWFNRGCGGCLFVVVVTRRLCCVLLFTLVAYCCSRGLCGCHSVAALVGWLAVSARI